MLIYENCKNNVKIKSIIKGFESDRKVIDNDSKVVDEVVDSDDMIRDKVFIVVIEK